MFYKLLAVAVSVFIIWQLVSYFRANPEAFSKTNMDRGVFALGVLALLLIGFVTILVLIVRH